MKAITLHQPYATLIASGIKTEETRSWKPPQTLIGEHIAIHAAKRRPVGITVIRQGMDNYILDNGALPLGAVLCTAKLRWAAKVAWELPNGMVKLDDGRYLQTNDYGDYSIGRWIWGLEDIRQVEAPIHISGRQRFWHLDLCPICHTDDDGCYCRYGG